jgi:uncharacterized membrane protein (UPF0127 family)
MRILTNLISPMTLFWYTVYALALFLIFIAGIWRVTRIQAGPPQKTNQKNKTQIRNVYEN